MIELALALILLKPLPPASVSFDSEKSFEVSMTQAGWYIQQKSQMAVLYDTNEQFASHSSLMNIGTGFYEFFKKTVPGKSFRYAKDELVLRYPEDPQVYKRNPHLCKSAEAFIDAGLIYQVLTTTPEINKKKSWVLKSDHAVLRGQWVKDGRPRMIRQAIETASQANYFIRYNEKGSKIDTKTLPPLYNRFDIEWGGTLKACFKDFW